LEFFPISKNANFGVIQGRLSKQTPQGYQAFPWDSWADEFILAAQRRLSHVEWIVDLWRMYENPIFEVPERVREISEASSIPVRSICADFLMQYTKLDASEAIEPLTRIIRTMPTLGATHLVVPFVDQTSLLQNRIPRGMVKEVEGIQICIESDLPPNEFADFVLEFESEAIGINYDIGNSAAMGYNWRQEFEKYWTLINLIHVKDRIRGGASVRLGDGDAEIIEILNFVKEMNFAGPISIQAFRDFEGLAAFDAQFEWLKNQLEVR
jgi:hexulose-6-phosphate isomerase